MKKDKFAEWDRFSSLCDNFTNPDEAFEIYKASRQRRIKPFAKKRTPGGRWKNYNPRAAVSSSSVQLQNGTEQKKPRNITDERHKVDTCEDDFEDFTRRLIIIPSTESEEGET